MAGSESSSPKSLEKTMHSTKQSLSRSTRVDELIQEQEERDRAEAQYDLWAAAKVPARHKGIRAWEELKGPDGYSAKVRTLREFTEDSDGTLAIIGPRGTGKTQAACVAIREAVRNLRSASYITALELLTNLKERYEPGAGSAADWLSEWSFYDLLVIDEISEMEATPHNRHMMTALIDKRYRNIRSTILLGNLDPAGFSNLVGGSICDRCKEGGGILRFEGWKSFRG